MADPISTGLVISGVATAGSIYSQNAGANAQQAAYRQRAQQERVSAAQRSIQRGNNLNSVLSTQRAMGGARGITSNSQSFQAVQEGTYQKYLDDEKADALNTKYNIDYLDQESSIARSNANVGMFNSLLNFGTGVYNTRGPRIA